jgi:hypothetical protein
MRKLELAKQLRQRLYEDKSTVKSTVDALSDDEVIDSYVTCSRCGKKEIGEEELRRAITHAGDIDQFIKACALSDHCVDV